MENKVKKRTQITFTEKIFDDIDEFSKLTGIPKATLLTKLWKSFKETQEYSALMLGIIKYKGE